MKSTKAFDIRGAEPWFGKRLWGELFVERPAALCFGKRHGRLARLNVNIREQRHGTRQRFLRGHIPRRLFDGCFHQNHCLPRGLLGLAVALGVEAQVG